MTGRTHQLRIHSLYMGHPILGCDLYYSATSQQLAERLLLHACDLYFQHPVTGEPVHGRCASPFLKKVTALTELAGHYGNKAKASTQFISVLRLSS